MRRILITSSSNPRLKNIRRLRRCRRADAFIAEGYRQVACALEAGAPIRELYVAPSLWLGGSEDELVRRAHAPVVELSPPAFESICDQARPDGVLAVVERWSTSLELLRPVAPPLVLVAESVERPGNLGTIVRSACGAGADALVVADGCTDPFHPETVRGSVGTIFKLPLAEARTDTAISWFVERGISITVATPEADRPCWDADLSGPTAVVVGNERHGVSRAWLEAAGQTVRIPMPGPADSLNVAVAAGVVLFEAARQRISRPGATGRRRPVPC